MKEFTIPEVTITLSEEQLLQLATYIDTECEMIEDHLSLNQDITIEDLIEAAFHIDNNSKDTNFPDTVTEILEQVWKAFEYAPTTGRMARIGLLKLEESK